MQLYKKCLMKAFFQFSKAIFANQSEDINERKIKQYVKFYN
jgi:hypothetical protein